MSVPEGRRAEHDVLVKGVCVALGTADPTHLEKALSRNIDWEFCEQEAIRHGVVSLLCDALDQVDATEPEAVPASVRDRLHEYHLDSVQRNLHLSGTLVRLLDRFEEAGVEVLPFKGPVLAVKAYDDLIDRPFTDLDLLVQPAVFPEAKQVLQDAGFTNRSAQTPTHEKINNQFGKDAIFHNDSCCIELHQRILPPRLGRGVRLDRLFERATTVDVAGATVPTASPAETLLIAAVHGMKHEWERLEWLAAVVALLEHGDVAWNRLKKEAESVGKTRMLGATLCLAQNVLNAPIPPELHEVSEDGYGQYVAAQLATDLLESRSEGPIQGLISQAETLDSTRARANFWARFLFGPQQADVDFIVLPPYLTRGYHVIRPLRLAVKLGQLAVEQKGVSE